MKKLLIYLPVALLLVLASCSDEMELKKSVFIPDDNNPDLPAYTEWGYNTFGAYYDRQRFLYDDYTVPAKMINTGGKTSFTLKGHISPSGYDYYGSANEMSLTFDFYSFDPQLYTDLITLNDLTVDLTGSTIKVRGKIDTTNFDIEILSGTIVFKRAQNLLVDKKMIEIILSGTFDFQALVDDEPISVTLGRFDVGIGKDNFYRY
jgi:hypothetical protein